METSDNALALTIAPLTMRLVFHSVEIKWNWKIFSLLFIAVSFDFNQRPHCHPVRRYKNVANCGSSLKSPLCTSIRVLQGHLIPRLTSAVIEEFCDRTLLSYNRFFLDTFRRKTKKRKDMKHNGRSLKDVLRFISNTLSRFLIFIKRERVQSISNI